MFGADDPCQCHSRVPGRKGGRRLVRARVNAGNYGAPGAYERIAKEHANSTRAPAALYKLGLLAEQRGDPRAARVYYQRVVAGYPRSEEAALARTKLSGPGG